MFVPIDRPAEGLRPGASQIAAGDWEVLSHFWYPLAIAAEVGAAPVKARLLDVEIVLFRDEHGAIAAMRDKCPHRYVRLSSGEVVDGRIECPFHGMRFDGTGQCRLVPALGRETRLPASYRVTAFPVRERYGLVWTCLGDPDRHALPSLPMFDDMAAQDITFGPVDDWAISAPRQIENFIDIAHLPYVHAATLGGEKLRALKPAQVEQHDDAVVLTAQYVEKGHDGGDEPAQYRYRVVLPFIVDFQVSYANHPDRRLISADIAAPISAYVSRVFQLHKVAGGPEAGKSLVAVLATVNAEDRKVLAELADPDLPLDMTREIHLPVDNVSHAYRQRLRALGLGAGD